MSAEGTVSPAPPGYTINVDNPEYIGYQLVISSTICTGLSAVFLGLRLYTRKFIVRSIGWDDWWMVLAYLFAISLTIGDCVETKYGMGVHLWDVTIVNFDTYLKLQLFVGASYIGALAFVKMSICCFYLRLSPNKTFRLMVFGVMAFTSGYSIAGFLVLIFSCNPISASWDFKLAFDPNTTCVNRPAEYLAQNSLNILADIVVFLLPLHTIWKLQLPFRQKVGVSSIFALGLLVCVVSMIRVKSLVVLLGSTDPTWDTSEVLIWSTIEVHATIVAACTATLKPFAKRFFPRLLGKGSSDGAAYPTIRGRSTKLDGNMYDAESFALDSYRGGETGQHMAIVTSKAGRDPRRRDGDAESQESIIGMNEQEMGSKEGVFVTRTVHIS